MSATCKWCKKPIEDDVNGFCKSEDDACWKAWSEHQKRLKEVAIGMKVPMRYIDPDGVVGEVPAPEEDNPISQGLQKSLDIAAKHDVCIRVVPAGGEVRDDEMVLDEETFRRIEQMAEEFGETPQELIRSLIKLEWEKAKKAGKVGES